MNEQCTNYVIIIDNICPLTNEWYESDLHHSNWLVMVKIGEGVMYLNG